jgi:transcriptional regulator with XRE-family HTH domain
MSDMQDSKDTSVCFWLQKERDRLGLSQAVIAAAAEVAVKTVGRWEREIAIPADKLKKLAPLGFDTQYVVTGVRSSAALTADEQQLLALFRAAPIAVKASTVAGLAAGAAIASPPQSVVVSGSGNRVGVRDYHEHHASDEGKQQDGDAQQKP